MGGVPHHPPAPAAQHTVDLLERNDLQLATGRIHHGDWSEAWGRRAAEAVLRTDPDTDAFFCGNDQIARGVADTLRENGMDVPGRIAIVGYDTWDVMPLTCRPPLTTIRQDFPALADRAVAALVAEIEGGADAAAEAPATSVVPTSLVVRSSTTAR